jgi:hypothetical protein
MFEFMNFTFGLVVHGLEDGNKFERSFSGKIRDLLWQWRHL